MPVFKTLSRDLNNLRQQKFEYDEILSDTEEKNKRQTVKIC